MPVIRWISEELAERCPLFVYGLFDSPRRTHRFGTATVRQLGRSGTATALASVLRALQRDGPFDVVHGFWATTPGLVAALAAWKTGALSVITLAGGELTRIDDIGYGEQRRVRSRAKVSLSLALADAVTAATPALQRTARAFGVSAELIPLGARRFPTPRVDRFPEPSLLAVGSLNRVKDHRTLLCATRLIRSEIPELRLDIVGEDTLGGETQRSALELGLGDCVRFRGHVPPDELQSYYARADLLVHTSRHEAGPLVVLEAAQHGVPTVGSSVGHIEEWSPHAALAVPNSDPPALANAILALLRDPERRAKLGESARRIARAQDAAFSARAFESLYEELQRRRRT